MQVSDQRQCATIGGTILAIALASTMPVTAQDRKSPPVLRDIPVAEWIERAIGRTVYYSIDGTPFGREYYAPDGRSVVFQHASGTCLEGEWTYREDITAYCYIWPNSVSCFRHVETDDGVQILNVEADGSPTLQSVQSVEQIVTIPLSCGPAVTS